MDNAKVRKRKRYGLPFFTASISTALVLILIGIITLLLLSAGKLSSELREEMTLELVLDDGLGQNEITHLQNRLAKADYTRECTYISKEDALDEMSAEMGVDPSEFLQYNPFYASLSLKLKAEYANRDSLGKYVPMLQEMSQIKEVNYERELLDSVNDNIRKVSVALIVLTLLLALISVTLINNTIKLTIYSLRFILYSMKLVGAKWSFIRKPFIRKNLRIGALASLLACLGIWGIIKLCAKYEPGIATLLDKSMLLPAFAVIIVAGLTITALCALFSVNRFLRMKSGELYYI